MSGRAPYLTSAPPQDIYQRTVNEACYYLSILDFGLTRIADGVIRIRFDLAATCKLINRRKFVDKLNLRPHETQSGRERSQLSSVLQFVRECWLYALGTLAT